MLTIHLHGRVPHVRVVHAPVLTESMQAALSSAKSQIEEHPHAFDGPLILVLSAAPGELVVYHASYAWQLAHLATQYEGQSEFGVGALSASLLLQNEEGEYLWVRRSENVVEAPGQWDVTACGGLESGEHSEKAAVREAVEELGIQASDITDVRPSHVFVGTVFGGCTVFFQGKLSGDVTLSLDEHEASEYVWSSTPKTLDSFSPWLEPIWNAIKPKAEVQ